jgi:hypothetical protein
MRAPPEVLPPPAIVAARDCLIGQFHISHPGWQPLLDSLSKAKAWHYLGKKRHPVITRAQLIDRCHMTCMREILNNKKWSDQDIALQMIFLDSFILTIAGAKTTTAADRKLNKMHNPHYIDPFRLP